MSTITISFTAVTKVYEQLHTYLQRCVYTYEQRKHYTNILEKIEIKFVIINLAHHFFDSSYATKARHKVQVVSTEAHLYYEMLLIFQGKDMHVKRRVHA